MKLSPLIGAPIAVVSLGAVGAFVMLGARGNHPTPASSSVATAASTVAPGARGGVHVDAELVKSGRVRVAPVERRAPRRELRVAGEIRSSEVGEADVGALVAGRVTSLEVGEGARVKKGQVLAWVDAPEVGRATAELLRARARARVASQKLARQLELEAEKATSKNAVDEARADAEIARADLAAARTLLLNLGGQEPPDNAGESGPISVRVAVRAPIPGVVSRHDAVLGAPVSPERTLFRIIADRQVAIIGKIPEGALKPALGTKAIVRSRQTASAQSEGNGGRECAAHTTGQLGAIEEDTRTLPLRLEPDDTCPWLAPGGYVDVVFPIAPEADAKPELVVPSDALVDVRGVPSVFVPAAGASNEFERRTVRVRTTVGADTVIEAGLTEGESVAVAGALLLKGELLRAELEGK